MIGALAIQDVNYTSLAISSMLLSFLISLNINIINFIEIRNAGDRVNHEILTWWLG